MTYCANKSKGPCHCQPQEGMFCPFDAGVAETQREMEPYRQQLDQKQADLDRALAESVQAIANKVCGDLPDGWEINLCMENGAACVEAIKPSGYTIEIDGGDLSLVEQINEAMKQALESQSDQPENAHD